MSGEVQRYQDPRLMELLEREQALEARVEELRRRFSGLEDIDQALELAAVRLEAANRLIELFDAGAPVPESEAALARGKAEGALRLVEGLRAVNVSEDQKDLVAEAPGYRRVRELLQEFLLKGGAGLLEERIEEERRLRLLARAVSEAIRKHAAPDDDYPPVFKTERLPRWLHSAVKFFLPVLAWEGQQDPPYGIGEGEEQVLWSGRMKMPLSQAIHYLENEVEPRLRDALAAEPGNPAVQRELRLLEDKLREYRSIVLRPRATPINLEKGFYTDWYSSYTADGELLVSVALPVISRSGTRLDRLRELVQNEIVRRLAGRGVCPAIDRDYRYRRSLASGRWGSSRLPGFKLDYGRGFQALKSLYPGLKRLEDRRELARLVEQVRSSGRRGSLRAVERLLDRGPEDRLRLP
jgi:hypothetical protein